MKNRNKPLEVQRKLFDEIRKIIPANAVLANTVSEVLNLCVSSAYKRISGDQLLTFGEVCMLCQILCIAT